ncbi:MAG: flagellar hook-length control protein FliK, partial [Desulfotignum sp.]
MHFADINQLFLNMVQPSGGKKNNGISNILSGQNTQEHPAFSTFLQNAKLSKNVHGNQEFQSRESVAAQDLDLDKIVAAQDLDLDKLEKIFSEPLAGETGQGFVLQLKQLLLKLANGDLKNISIDQEGLGVLAKLLEKAGFAKQDLADLMDDLSDTESKTFSMDEIMNHLLTLPTDSLEDKNEETLLASSAQPFVISLLQSFAIPEETISTILSEADRSQNGISLDVIIEKLKAMEEESLHNKTLFQIKAEHSTIASALDSLKMTLPQQSNAADTSPIFLADLTAAFQALKSGQMEKNSQSMGKGDDNKNQTAALAQRKQTSSRDLLATLFKHLEVSKNQLDQKTLQADIPQALLKNVVSGELMPGFRQLDLSKGQVEPASLMTDMKPEQVVKEIQALLSGKSGGETQDNPAFQQKFNRMMKSFSSRTTDQNQMSGADVKGGDSMANLDALKAKTGFKNLPTYVTQQVGKSLVRAINQGENTLKIILKPPELGRLVMHIDNTGNSMKVSIMPENHAAKEMLIANVNELRTVLS